MKRMRRLRRAAALGAIALLGFALWLTWDDEPAGSPFVTGTVLPGSGDAVGLEQGWSLHTLQRAWFTSFGSRLLERTWFGALERADGGGLFRDDDYLATFGFLPQARSADNADGFPVGIAVGGDGADQVGLTCAACHTGELHFHGQRLRIAGGAGMIDITRFEQALLRALQATLADDARFKRFAARVGADPALRRDLAARTEHLAQRLRMNRVDVAYGPGRMDAFGQIFNAVSADFSGVPDNFHAPDAPVSIPSLWNAPRMDRVQWNGSSPNDALAPLVQNVTTALAVYGQVDLRDPGTLGYRSSVDVAALGRLQNWLTRLRSPRWPEALLGKLDTAAIARGRAIYAQQCQRCHVIAERDNAAQALATQVVPLEEIGTDARMAVNFAEQRVATGVLSGRRVLVWGGAPLEKEARAIDLVVHAALGATLQHPLLALRAALAGHASAAAANESAIRGYKAGPLAGIWATAPYLHNGSVPTLFDLLQAPQQRPAEFPVGDREFDADKIGLAATGAARFDTRLPGNGNAGHAFGTALENAQKRDLLEFLKSL